MNFLKRACYSLKYHVKNTALLFVVFLLLSALILSGFCVADACRESDETIRKNVGGVIWLQNSLLNESPDKYTSVIDLEIAEKATEINGVAAVECNSELLADAGSFSAVVSETQLALYPDSPTLRLCGYTDLVGNIDFASESAYLLSYEEDPSGAVVHQTLAQANELDLGDKITVVYGEKSLELTISGIFATTAAGTQQLPPYLEAENAIYTNIDNIWTLSDDKVLSHLYIKTEDPTNANQIADELISIISGYPYSEGMTTEVDTAAYDSVASVLKNVMGTVNMLIIGAAVMGSVILVLLTYLSVKEREYEIGVLLSIGETKLKLLLQMLLEVLVPALAAITAAVIAVSFTAPQLGQLIGNAELSVSLEVASVLSIYLCGTLLTVVANIPMMAKVLKYNPKKFLISAE